jgi:hypothetical protein
MGNGGFAFNRDNAELVTMKAFLYDLVNPDALGLYCSSDVQDRARALLGLPPLVPFNPINEYGEPEGSHHKS